MIESVVVLVSIILIAGRIKSMYVAVRLVIAMGVLLGIWIIVMSGVGSKF